MSQVKNPGIGPVDEPIIELETEGEGQQEVDSAVRHPDEGEPAVPQIKEVKLPPHVQGRFEATSGYGTVNDPHYGEKLLEHPVLDGATEHAAHIQHPKTHRR